MSDKVFKIAFLLGALGVALGAFGAHALKKLLDVQQLQTYHTAVQYHFYHVFALAITGLLLKSNTSKWLLIAGRLFIIGIILFSGSLYVLSLLNAVGVKGFSWLGAITPLGGVCFISGWICLVIAMRKII